MRPWMMCCAGILLAAVATACGQGAGSDPQVPTATLAVGSPVPRAALEASCRRFAAAANAELEKGSVRIQDQVCRWQSPRHLLLLSVDEPAAAAEAFTAMKRLGLSRVTSVAGREAFFANQGQLVIRDGDRLLFLAGLGNGMDRENVEQRVATTMLR